MAKGAQRAGGAARGRRDLGPNGGVEPPDEARRIVEAALARLAQDGWRRLSLAAIAEEAGLPILRVYRNFRSKQAILAGFMRRIDETVLAEPPPAEGDERPRDRLFDLLMRRFDALRPYKPALAVLRRELPVDPASALCVAASLLRSMRWMLEAADITTGGMRGAVRRQADRGRLSGDDAGVAARRGAGSGADHGGARCAVAPHRAMVDAGPNAGRQ